MRDATDDLAGLWRWFAAEQFRGYSPMYERVAVAVADDRAVLELLRASPPEAHLPTVPLAAARYLLLDGLEHPLGDVYAGRSDADPGPLFLDLCRNHRTALLDVMATRRVQTNDCGRSALIGPALTWTAERLEAPYCLVDVGASAGINLLCDRYLLDYGPHGTTGPPDSPVHVTCDVVGGTPPIAERLPAIEHRLGIDLSPVDLTDPASARWLLACVWPDTGRAERVETSIRLVQQDPPTLVTGRANLVLPGVLDDLPTGTMPVVVTTWAFAYFSLDERAAFVELLRSASDRQPLAWLSAENTGVVEVLGTAGDSPDDTLGVVVFDHGDVSAFPLARVQGHGNWIDWRAES